MTAFADRLNRFSRDESGTITLLMLVLFISILLMTGLALDLAKHESQRADLQSALDRGVMPAASVRQTLEYDAEDDTNDITRMIRSYVSTRTLSGEEANIEVVDKSTLGERRFGVSADFGMPTDFFRLVGVSNLQVSGFAEAAQGANLEISLLLDISGSMRFRVNGGGTPSPNSGQSRIFQMIPAAKSFIDSVTANGTEPGVRINLIPYAGQVNPGEWMFDSLGGKSCTPERSARNTMSDASGNYLNTDCNPDIVDTPKMLRDKAVDLGEPVDFFVTPDPDPENGIDEGKFVYANYDPDVHTDINPPDPLWAHDNGYCMYLEPDAFGETRAVRLPSVSIDAEPGQVPHFHHWGIASKWMQWGWCPSEKMKIMYMASGTEDYDALIDTIDSFALNLDEDGNWYGNLHDGTGTYTAMKWGAALLNPDTKPVMDDMAADGLIQPDAESGENMFPLGTSEDWTRTAEGNLTPKFIVLFTDGQVNHDIKIKPSDLSNPEKIASFTSENAGNETNNDSSVGTTKFINKRDGRDYLKDVCKQAKENGVTIFTIAFLTSDSEMKECASEDGFAYSVKSDSDMCDLGCVFGKIASNIKKLQLTQ